jgi:hypothetical protein
MVTHMKTTVDIADRLLTEAKKEAVRRGTTLKELLETALRHHLEDASRRPPFVLQDGSVEGRGVQAGIDEGDWDSIRALIYQGHGG